MADTEVAWIVLHDERDAVLVIDGQSLPVLPSSTLPGAVWVGDAPVFTDAWPGSGLDAILLGCRDLIGQSDMGVQQLTMVTAPRPGAVGGPPGSHWAGPAEARSVVPRAM